MLFKDEQPELRALGQEPRTAVPPPPPVRYPPVVQVPVVQYTAAEPPVPPPTVDAPPPPPSPPPAPTPKPKLKKCDFYILGKCKNGKKCPFAHVGTPIESPADSEREHRDETDVNRRRSSKPPPTVCRYILRGEHCKIGHLCYFSHVLPREERSSKKRTKVAEEEAFDQDSRRPQELPKQKKIHHEDYANSSGHGKNNKTQEDVEDDGWGSKGKYAGWSGSEKDGQQETQAWDQEDNSVDKWNVTESNPYDQNEKDNSWGSSTKDNGWKRNSGSSGSGTPTNARPCFDFTQGRCTRGSRCRFSHQTDGSSGSGGSRDGNRGECWQYKQGRCNRGQQCRFKHVDEESTPNTAGNTEWANAGWAATEEGKGWGVNEDNAEQVAEEDQDTAGWEQNGTEEQADELAPQEDGFDWAQDVENQEEHGLEGDEGEEELHHASISEEVASSQQDQEAELTERHDDLAKTGSASHDEPEPECAVDSWNAESEWAGQEIEAPEFVSRKRRGPCLKFGQGTCTKGEACEYDHILPDDQKEFHEEGSAVGEGPIEDDSVVSPDDDQEEEEEERSDRSPSPEIQEVHPPVERYQFDCTVAYNAQCEPETILTSGESKTLNVSNLPEDAAPEAIRGLVASDDEVSRLIGDGTQVTFEFSRPQDAMEACLRLNGCSLFGKLLATRLESRSQISARSPTNSLVLSLSWPTATVTAWVYYRTAAQVKEAERKVNGQVFEGRTLKAGRFSKKGSFVLRVSGFPPSVGKTDVGHLCSDPTPALIELTPPTYTESPKDHIKADIEKLIHGPVTSFDYSPEENLMTKTVAFATLQSHAAALTVASALNGVKPGYLGGEDSLSAQHVHISRHGTLPKAFDCIIDQFNLIKQNFKGKCKITSYEANAYRVVQVTATWTMDQPSAFSDANAQIQALLSGLVVTSDGGDIVWDDYFASPSGIKAITALNDKPSDVPSYIYADERYKIIRVFGAPDAQQLGRSTVLKLIRKLGSARHELPISRGRVAPLLDRALKDLQDSLGNGKISLDLVSSKIIVKGGEDDRRKVQDVLDALPPIRQSKMARSKLCVLCEQVPALPVKLSCRHIYCTRCLQLALKASLTGDGSPFLSCIFARKPAATGGSDGGESLAPSLCGARIPYAAVRDVLPVTDEFKYLSLSFRSFIRANQDKYFFCPTPSCQSVYRVGVEGIVIQCSRCGCDICAFCRSRSHDDRPCGS